MKRVLLLTMALMPIVLCAGRLADWYEKREIFSREAERLRDAYKAFSARVTEPSENVIIPVETYDDGSVKFVVTAGKAQIFTDEDVVWASEVIIRKFTDKGEEESRIEAGRCLVDRESKSGWVEGPAKVKQGKTEFSGKDLYFSSEESYLQSYSDSHIETKDLKFGGVL